MDSGFATDIATKSSRSFHLHVQLGIKMVLHPLDISTSPLSSLPPKWQKLLISSLSLVGYAMLNPRAPPFEYSPPPPALLPPLPPPPFVEYFPPPFSRSLLSPPPYAYAPPFSHNFFLYLAPRPPHPILPPPSTAMSNLTTPGVPQFKDQEVELHSGTVGSNLPPPSPPAAAAATIAHYPRKKDAKPRCKKRWVPRAAQKNKQTKQVGASLEFDEDPHSQSFDQRTTVMIRNIPNKLSRDMLMDLLDKHCAQKNKEAGNSTPSSAYDFIYLPIDFKNGCNLGYAFVNFTSPAAARRLYEALHRHKWMVFRSSKISHVCYARIQGRRALEEHFRYSIFRCDADVCFPAVLSPPRDGCGSLPAPVPVGRRYSK